MKLRFSRYWFPEYPNKYSCFRCIRFYGILHPILELAGKEALLTKQFLTSILPEFILWIDPFEVTYRFGEHSPIYVLYNYTYPNPWSYDTKLVIHKTSPILSTFSRTSIYNYIYKQFKKFIQTKKIKNILF